MENKYKKLLKNTSIFALGTFGSKILVFLIVPLYTHILSTTDYGKIDLITSSVSLLIPFTTLLIYEAAIRFLVGKEYKEKNVFNNCVFIFFAGCILSVALSPLLLHFLKLNDYYYILICLLVLTSYTTIFSQYLRAIGDNWSFSISGIINTFCTVTFNLITLLVLKMGINGYLYSLLISQLITCIYIFIKCKTLKNLNYKFINFKTLKYMLVYSIPLIPNNIMWWIMNAGDKYVINHYLGTSSNGIFSISYKIPTILTMIFSIFMQAWQVSAIEERTDKTRNTFYGKVFNYIAFILVIFTSGIIIFVKPVFELIIGNDYIGAWKYVPLLCIATLFNCFSTFAGVVYIIEKKSKKAFYTTFIGAIANLFFNFLLIRSIGLLGVAIGTAIGYAFVMLLRFNDYSKYFNTSLLSIKFVSLILILIIQSCVYMFKDNIIRYIFSIVCFITIIIISKKEITNVVDILRRRINSDKNRKNEVS